MCASVIRLEQALKEVQSSPSASDVNFTLHFEPYQLFPDFAETADKKAWYLHEKHFDNEAAAQKYQDHMTSLLEPLGVKLSFEGKMGNTLHAHRVIQHVQESKGPEVTDKLVEGLYKRYFIEAKHPAAGETIEDACVEAGLPKEEAAKLVQDKDEGLSDVKMRLREVARDTDAVPVVVVEGKRRDITLTGAKEVKDYVKALETVIKESH